MHFSVEFSMERLVNYGMNQKKKRSLIDDQKYEYNFEKKILRMKQCSGDARSSRKDARGGQFHGRSTNLL